MVTGLIKRWLPSALRHVVKGVSVTKWEDPRVNDRMDSLKQMFVPVRWIMRSDTIRLSRRHQSHDLCVISLAAPTRVCASTRSNFKEVKSFS